MKSLFRELQGSGRGHHRRLRRGGADETARGPHDDRRAPSAGWAASAACSSWTCTGMHPPGAGLRHRRRGHQAEDRLSDGQARHRGHRLCGHVRQRRDHLRREAPGISGLHRLRQECARRRSPPSWRAWPRAASRRAQRLVGGETAEMPGFYPEHEYDLAGFTVGVVEKSKIIDNTKMQAGDAVIALPSSGRALQRLFAGAQDIQRGVRRMC